MTLSDYRDAAEREAIVVALEDNQWNQSWAAVAIGIHRNSLHRLMKKHNIGVKPEQRKAVCRAAWFASQRKALAVLGCV